LIYAIGQVPQKQIVPETIDLLEDHRTSDKKLFVAGDFSMGNGDVIHAVADGKSAADAIDTFLMGKPRIKRYVEVQEADQTGRIRIYDFIEPAEMPVIPVSDRQGNNEVETGYMADQRDGHAKRCYLCNYKFEIDQDLCIHCDWCIRVSPRNCIKRLESVRFDKDGNVTEVREVDASSPEKATYIWIDSDECIRCSNCYNICPTGAISLRKTDRRQCPDI
jgi:formate dehydrogenase major subunit